MTQRSNVLGRSGRPTKKSYRDAVKKIVLRLQADNDLNDPELAERLGCSAPTIANARRELTNLDGVTLANIEYEFGPSALDPFLALGGSRSVPIGGLVSVNTNVAIALLDAVRVIIETQAPHSDNGSETSAKEAALILSEMRAARCALDSLIALGETAIVAEVA
jgi:hypothetical protein